MTTPASPAASPPSRIFAGGEWLLVVGLAATLAWTTLCLGGYLTGTMVVTAGGVFGLAIIGGLLWAWGNRGRTVAFNLAVLLPAPFLLYALVSVYWLAPAPWLAWREWLLWLQMWLVFALVLHFGPSRRHTWIFVGTFIGLGLAGVVMAIHQRFGNPAWLMLGRNQAAQFYGRSAGMFGIPNSLAGLLELMIPACLTIMASRQTRPGTRLVCAGLALLFGFTVILTGSRGGWIALVVALLAWPLLGSSGWRQRLTGVVLLLGLTGVAALALYRFSPEAQLRLQPLLEGKFESSRPILWKAGLQIWRDHPWWGSGAASFNVLFDQYRPRGFLNEPDWMHNDYLNTLGDYGLIGFFLWVGAGWGLFRLGWSAVQRARREKAGPADIFSSRRWRLGLWLGLLAFAFHLGVDFHTKLPALALAFAVGFGLLLRDEASLIRPFGGSAARVLALGGALGGILLTVRLATPLYQAESLRFEARKNIDRYTTSGSGNFNDIIRAAKADFARAVRIDPANGQAWSDLAYATVQGRYAGGGDLAGLGRFAELAADEALKICPLNAEFWVRKGVALSMLRGRPETEDCFRRALQLAPNSPIWWYHYGYFLSSNPERKADALNAIETCLTLDPYFAAGKTLRQQLVTRY